MLAHLLSEPSLDTSIPETESGTSLGGTGCSTANNQTSGHPNNKREADSNVPRVQLACFYCRAKRIRCSGDRPLCSACSKANVACEWPAGRRPKRTRREMEEARRADAAQLGVGAGEGAGSGGDAGVLGPVGEARPGETSGPQSSEDRRSVEPLLRPLSSRSASSIRLGEAESLKATVQSGNATQDELWIDPWTTVPLSVSSPNSFQWPANFVPDTSLHTFSFDALGAPATLNASSAVEPSFNSNGAAGASTTSASGNIAHAGEPANTSATLESFLHDNSPSTDQRLLQAVESQAAYLSGVPGADDDLELYYYRFSGSTAIHPGIHRVSLKLQRRRPGASPIAAPQPEPELSPTGVEPEPPVPADLFDESGLTHWHVYEPLLDAFMTHLSAHFPSVSKRRMKERCDTGTMSAFLATCQCALSARFTSKSNPGAAAAPFIAKAEELVTPLLHLPTTDTTTGLLLLAWACYGQGSDSGLWQYTGMAIRMGMDLGVHQQGEVFESAAHQVRNRLLCWSLFVTDRIVSFATGRPSTIPEEAIEIPLPDNADFFPDRAHDDEPNRPAEPVQPVPFVYLTRLMVLCGRISNLLNGRRGCARTLVTAEEPMTERLAELQARLVSFYAALPEPMKWSADNFKFQKRRGHGGTFLALHLWANAVLALVYHPELLKSPTGTDTPLSRSMPRNVRLAIASSRQICECMVFADLVDETSYIASPIIVQPLYVAATALLQEMHIAQASEGVEAGERYNPIDVFLVSMARQNFQTLLKAVHRIGTYWAGAGYVANLLQRRSGVTLSSTSSTKRTFISLPDNGLLRRYTSDPHHPKDIAPPTKTSLRESMARHCTADFGSGGGAKQLDTMWISDLLSGYSVENMSFSPANGVDFARLVAHSPEPMPTEGLASASGVDV